MLHMEGSSDAISISSQFGAFVLAWILESSLESSRYSRSDVYTLPHINGGYRSIILHIHPFQVPYLILTNQMHFRDIQLEPIRAPSESTDDFPAKQTRCGSDQPPLPLNIDIDDVRRSILNFPQYRLGEGRIVH
mmetsp:Transcript_2077/g.5102  ORF Transcript_2077/g.5102 Transcript_2077/m.5102 type:complete len:134 (+) Transcript_2077:65-466(+)